MNLTTEIRRQFTLFAFCDNIDLAVSIKTEFAAIGYEAFMFSDQEALLSRLAELPPHLIIFTKSVLSTPLQDFVQSVVDINSEILFLPICAASDVADLVKYREFNFVGLCLDGFGMLSRLTWMVDEAVKGLYTRYQSEQVLQAMEKVQKEVVWIQQQSEQIKIKSEKSSGIILNEELMKYQHADSKEKILQIFLKELGQKFLAKNNKISALFLKYLPSVQAFVATQSLGVDLESIRGVGGKFTAEEMKNPVSMIADGHVPKMLQDLLHDGFHVKDYIFQAVFIDKKLDGFFVFWSQLPAGAKIYKEEVENDLALFTLAYERGHLRKQLQSLEVADQVTELHNQQFYNRVLADEIVRARRLQKAVSVVKLSIDHFPELEQILGSGGRDQVLRLVASLMKKTSRVNDVSCRLADNQFAIILPHAARKGATIRAERIRRMIESQIFQHIGQKVTMSLGVSEYPSFCSTAEDLDRSATEALVYISGKGGNKVCLFHPKENFLPDFNVPPL